MSTLVKKVRTRWGRVRIMLCNINNKGKILFGEKLWRWKEFNLTI